MSEPQQFKKQAEMYAIDLDLTTLLKTCQD